MANVSLQNVCKSFGDVVSYPRSGAIDPVEGKPHWEIRDWEPIHFEGSFDID